MELTISIQGSAAEPYQVRITREGSNVTCRCTCRAGAFGALCKHQLAVLTTPTDALRELLHGSDVESAYASFLTALQESARAEANYKRQRDALAAALKD